MNVIEKVDDYIMHNFFERIAWSVEERWQINNYQITRGLLAVYGAAYCSYAMASARPKWLIALILFLVLLLFARSFENERRAKKKFLNPDRSDVFTMLLRFFVLPSAVWFFVQPILSVDWLDGLTGLSFWLYLGFDSCNPKPPAYKETAREPAAVPESSG